MSKKRLIVEQVPGSTLHRLKWEGGGELPHSLKGSYTSVKEAQHAIARWEADENREVEMLEAYKMDEAKKAESAKQPTK